MIKQKSELTPHAGISPDFFCLEQPANFEDGVRETEQWAKIPIPSHNRWPVVMTAIWLGLLPVLPLVPYDQYHDTGEGYAEDAGPHADVAVVAGLR